MEREGHGRELLANGERKMGSIGSEGRASCRQVEVSVSNRAGACQGCRLSRVQAAARNRVGDGTLRLGLEAGVQSV